MLLELFSGFLGKKRLSYNGCAFLNFDERLKIGPALVNSIVRLWKTSELRYISLRNEKYAYTTFPIDKINSIDFQSIISIDFHASRQIDYAESVVSVYLGGEHNTYCVRCAQKETFAEMVGKFAALTTIDYGLCMYEFPASSNFLAKVYGLSNGKFSWQGKLRSILSGKIPAVFEENLLNEIQLYRISACGIRLFDVINSDERFGTLLKAGNMWIWSVQKSHLRDVEIICRRSGFCIA